MRNVVLLFRRKHSRDGIEKKTENLHIGFRCLLSRYFVDVHIYPVYSIKQFKKNLWPKKFNMHINAVLRIRIRIRIQIPRIHVFLGLPDPDPLVRAMDPDPDPDLDPTNNKQK